MAYPPRPASMAAPTAAKTAAAIGYIRRTEDLIK
jgi:hypothetical protein